MKKILILLFLFSIVLSGCQTANQKGEQLNNIQNAKEIKGKKESVRLKIVGYSISETTFSYTTPTVTVIYNGKVTPIVLSSQHKVEGEIDNLVGSYLYGNVIGGILFKNIVIKKN